MKIVMMVKVLQRVFSKLDTVVTGELQSNTQIVTIKIDGTKAHFIAMTQGFFIREEVDIVSCEKRQYVINLPMVKFSNIVRVLSHHTVTLNVKDDEKSLAVSCGRSRFSLQYYDERELPFDWPEADLKRSSSKGLLALLKRFQKVSFKGAIEDNQTQKEVVNIASDNFATTDGVVLAVAENRLFEVSKEFNLSINHLQKVIKALNDFSGDVIKYTFNDDRFFLEAGNSCLAIQNVVLPSYYSYRQLLASYVPKFTFKMSKIELHSVLKSLLAAAGKDKVAQIVLSSEGLHFSIKCDISSSETFVDCEVPIEGDIKMYMDVTVFTRAVDSIATDTITIDVTAPNMPLRLTEDNYVCFVQSRRLL